MSWKDQKFNAVVDKCREKGTRSAPNSKCNVRLPPSSTVYCGETLRDEINRDRVGGITCVCDCIVCIEGNKISLVELKGGVLQNDVREQFQGGISILKHILPRKTKFSFQAVLATGRSIRSTSEKRALQRSLKGIRPNVSIEVIKCKCPLPKEYIPNCYLVG